MFTKSLKVLVAALFVLGVLGTGVLGTETRSLFFWPGCALIGIAGLVAGLRWRWRLRFMPSDACLASALVFGIYMLARQITSPVEGYAREDAFILLGCAVAYSLGATVLSDSHSRRWLLITVLLLTIGNLVVGFIHFSGKWAFHIVPGYMRSFGEEQRIGGFFNNPNHLASFLAMSSLLLAANAIFGRGGAAWRLLLGFVALTAAIGIALSMSRGGLLGLAAGGVTLAVSGIFVLWKTQRHLVSKVLAGVGVLSVLGGVVLYGVFSEQLQMRLKGGGFSSGDPRPFIWEAALAQHAEHPVFGAGARMFYDGCITYRAPESPPWMKDAEFAHNEWIQILADYGWVGLGLVLVMLVAHFANLAGYLRWFVRDKFPRTATLMSTGLGISLGAGAALVALLVHAVFEFNFHVPAVAVVAACLLGICANPGCTPEARKPMRVPGARLGLKLGLIGASACILWGAATFGRADYFAEKAALPGVDDDVALAKLEWLTKAIAADPKNARFWEQRGSVRISAAAGQPMVLAQGLLKRAASDLEQARRLNPNSLTAALELVDALTLLGEMDKAAQVIADAVVMAPLFEAPRLALARHYFRLQQWDRAEQAYFFVAEARAGKSGDWFTEYRQMLKDASDAAK
jgi:O-antigen ligase